MIIGIVVAGVAVLALVGVAIGLFVGGNKNEPMVPPPAPPTVAPTTSGPTTSPTPTTGPSPTTAPTQTTGGQTPAGAISIGSGMSVTPEPGWTVQQQTDDGVALRDGQGRVLVLTTGTSADPQAEVQRVLNTLSESATDIRRTEVRTVEVHPSLSVATQNAVYTVASQGGTSTRWSYALVSQRTADGVGLAAATVAPAADLEDEAFASSITAMIASALTTQVQ